MSLYHLSVKVIGRSSGRSATAAAAYRAAEKIVDQRTGLIHDFTRKQGVEYKALLVPGDINVERGVFWNSVELHHKRGDAVVSREIEIALPDELTAAERTALAIAYARELVERYKVAADVAIHAPSREGDERNHHAHIMLSACLIDEAGALGKRAAELDPIYCQKHRLPNMADRERERWAVLTNEALERAGHVERVDHRSLAAQGIDRIPTSHMGPSVSGMVRRGALSAVSMRVSLEVQERLQEAKTQGEQLRQLAAVEQALIDTSADLASALRERDANLISTTARTGVNAFRAKLDEKRRESVSQRSAQAVLHLRAELQAKEAQEQARKEAHARELAEQRKTLEEAERLKHERSQRGPTR